MSNRQNILPRIQEPIAVGDLMRQLFIVREDGSVDHDMLAAHIFADEQSQIKKRDIATTNKHITFSKNHALGSDYLRMMTLSKTIKNNDLRMD